MAVREQQKIIYDGSLGPAAVRVGGRVFTVDTPVAVERQAAVDILRKTGFAPARTSKKKE